MSYNALVTHSVSTRRRNYTFVVRFALNSLHANYGTVTGALDIISTVDAVDDSNVKLVTANRPISRTGSLADLAQSNIGSGVFLDEYVDDQDYDERGKPLIGLTGAFGTKPVRYIRPNKGSNYGTGDGITPGTAYDGPQDTDIGSTAGVLDAGTVYYFCDIHHHIQSGTPVLGTQGDITLEDAVGGASTDIRGDHPLMPGMVCGGWVDGRAVASWTKDGSSNMYSQSDAIQRTVATTGWTLKPEDATLSKTALEDYILEHVATIQDCRDTPGSIHIPDTVGTTGTPKIAYVHAPDGSDPTDRVMQSAFGYDFLVNASPQIGNFKFINLTLFECKETFAGWGSGGIGSGNTAPDTIYFLGCRIILPHDMQTFNKATLHHYGASSDGRVLWDVTDRPNKNDSRIQDLRAHAKASPRNPGDSVVDSKFADMDRWTHIVRSTNGPYALSVLNTDVLSQMVIDGVIIEDIGDSNFKGLDLSDNDMHAIGGQRCVNWDLQRFCIFRAGSAVNLYSKASGTMPTTGTAQDLSDNTIAWFLIDGNNQEFGNPAGQNGIAINGDNDSILADNGTGDKSGNVVEFFYIRNMVPNVADENDAIALTVNNEQNTTYRDYIIENCNQDIRGQRNYTDANSKVWGSYTTLRNGKHIRGDNSNNVWWERSGTWVSGSGVIDADDMEIVLKGGESAATELFDVTGTGSATLATVQALTKTNGGAAANVSSIFWTNTTLT